VGSARVARAGFGVAPKQSFVESNFAAKILAHRKVRDCGTRSPARATRALPGIIRAVWLRSCKSAATKSSSC